MQTFQKLALTVKERVKSNFAYATFHFILIMFFIAVFTTLFGANNSIVAIIFVQITLSTISRDLTASLFKNFVFQTIVLSFMTIGACISVNIPPIWALLIHLIVVFIILYVYTFDYIRQLYFPYVLSYLFLVCLAPISFAQLPIRIISVIFGCVCIMLYQYIINRKRIVNTTRQVLLSILDEANAIITAIINHEEVTIKIEQMRASLMSLSQIVYDRRKKLLCLSDAALATIDVARGLENLVIDLYEKDLKQDKELLYQTAYYLSCFKSYLLEEMKEIPILSKDELQNTNVNCKDIYLDLNFIRNQLLAMNNVNNKRTYEYARPSINCRLKTAIQFSEVRFVYALRLAILLSFMLFIVQYWQLEHGRWLLFTIVSISLPYVEEMLPKAKKRIMATLVGGTISLLCFSFIDDSSIRTLILMLSGYITFYCVDYKSTFICSTIGALGGNILATSFGIQAVGHVVLIRLIYIVAGIIIALLVSHFIYPYNKKKALAQLLAKYHLTNDVILKLCQQRNTDKQQYYHLILHSFMQEYTLRQHARDLNDSGRIEEVLSNTRLMLRRAHT